MKKNNEHLYEIVYKGILNDIRTGVFSLDSLLPTELEIANSYNVSKITVKKALEMLVEEGYVRRIRGKGSFIINNQVDDKSAAMNTAEKSRVIGFVLPDYSGQYAVDMLRAIEEEATKRNIFLIHMRSHGIQQKEEEAIEKLITYGVMGIIIMPVHGENYNPILLKLILEDFPIVFVDRHLKGLSASFVTTDNIQSSKRAVDYLLENGHKKICFVSPTLSNTSTLEERMQGFIESHTQKNLAIEQSSQVLAVDSTIPGRDSLEDIQNDIEKISQHLQKHRNISALFASEYNIALLCYKAAQQAGYQVPEDLSIICFDEPGNHINEYQFTHIKQNEEEMGKTALRLILENKPKNEKIFLESELIIGHSTAPKE